MSFNRPTLQELIVRVENDFKGELGITTLVRRSFLKVFAKVYAGLAYLLFLFLGWLEREAFADTAVDTLLRHAAIWGISQKVATFAQFQVTVTGTNGTVIPALTQYKSESGAFYLTDAAVTILTGSATLDLTAEVSGASNNPSISDVLTIVSPIAGLNSQATVSAITTEAEDLETLESVRQRLIDRIQNPPSGGAPNDYVQWAREVPGVTRAWVLPLNLGPGTVGVSFVEDGNAPASIVPSPAKVQEVNDYIYDPSRRPVTANVNVFAPLTLPLDMVVKIRPNNAQTQEAISTQIDDLLLRDAALQGAYKSPTETFDGTILLSRIREAISIAVGEEDNEIVSINTLAPADVVPATNELVVKGTITWQTL